VYGSPQWQIDATRRLEIPEDMQKKYGFAPLGDANSATKQMPAYSRDRLAQLKSEYELAAKEPSNLRYGYVRAG
jgi:uncharacterized protein